MKMQNAGMQECRMVGGEKEKRSPENRFETQRSGKVNPGGAGRESPLEGFKSERRSKRSEADIRREPDGAERSLRRRGPIAQLARAHD